MRAHSPEETHALLAEAFNAGDLGAFVDVYEEDAALLVPPEGRLVTGRGDPQRHRAHLRPRPDGGDHGRPEAGSDGVALTHARWSIVGTEPGGEAVKLAGQGSIVSRRQPDATSLN